MSRELPYFRWYPADAESDARYAALDFIERGIYHKALNYSWTNDGLPLDDGESARLLKMSVRELKSFWPRVRACFEEIDGKLRNSRQEKERADAIRISEKRAKAGAQGGKEKAIASHLLEVCYSKPSIRAYESECVYGFDFESIKKNLPLNGKPSQRWEEFQELYPYKIELDNAARQFVSTVSVDNEAAVFECLARYLGSDQVARGAVMKPAKWLLTGHRDGWAGDWPKPHQKKQPKGLEDD